MVSLGRPRILSTFSEGFGAIRQFWKSFFFFLFLWLFDFLPLMTRCSSAFISDLFDPFILESFFFFLNFESLDAFLKFLFLFLFESLRCSVT